MLTSTKTIYSIFLQLQKLRNSNFKIYPYTTINEKFNINSKLPIKLGEYPSINYSVIGNGGHKEITDSTGTQLKSIRHKPTHASLYNFIPYRAIPLNQDIEENTEDLRLRIVKKINDIDYAIYYAKKLKITSSPSLFKLTIDKGVIKTENFVPDQANLNPNEVLLHPNILEPHNTYLVALDTVNFELSTQEIEWIHEAYKIIQEDENALFPIISEIGICSGLELETVKEINGLKYNYKDAYAVQICYFINSIYKLFEFKDTGLNKYFHIGSMEPVLDY